MNIEYIRRYFLSKPGADESMPFGEDALVFKVSGKIFGIAGLSSIPLRISLKCDPERAVELRERYEAVLPGYHLNKKHWNTVVLDGSVPRSEVQEWIDHSYALVVAGLPARARDGLQ